MWKAGVASAVIHRGILQASLLPEVTFVPLSWEKPQLAQVHVVSLDHAQEGDTISCGFISEIPPPIHPPTLLGLGITVPLDYVFKLTP